jgi:adenosylcobyric acid synthase
MIQGVASGVGKTILTMALCRIFRQDGYTVSPFKGQNVTSNTAFTENGDEIALSQLLQAYAAGAKPDADMNPLILKMAPESRSFQVVLNGNHYGDMSSVDFTVQKKKFLTEIADSYSRLSAQCDVIVIEGAGSPVELNLKSGDIANMGIAKLANAPVLLAADIDRGGVFASLSGTLNLLDESEKKHVKATVVNRFKGDVSSFSDGVSIIEKITGVPVLGVVPYVSLDIPEEDVLYDSKKAGYDEIRDLNSQFDLIAGVVRRSFNMELLYDILNGGMENSHG